MINSLLGLISAIWEILLRVPMPLRAGVVVLVTVTIAYWMLWRVGPWILANLTKLVLLLVRGLVSLLLLVEYAINRPRRRRNRNPFPGTFVFGDIMEKIGSGTEMGTKKLTTLIVKRKPPRKIWIFWAMLFAVVPILLWYSRPNFEGTKLGGYIDKSVTWWNSFEGWALTGVWAPSALAAALPNKPEEDSPTTSPEPAAPTTPSNGRSVKIKINSTPAGASITVNGEASGTTPIIYEAKPREKLTIKFEAPDFEPLEIERTAPAGGMTIVEYPLVPINFPFGTWTAQIGEKAGKLELQRGQAGTFQAQLIIENGGQEVGNQIKLRGRYDPVQKTLSLNEIESAAARLKTILSDDLKNMRGELRFSDNDSTLSFEANWKEE
jgi:PEGA domain